MKKIVTIFALVLLLTGCGDKNNDIEETNTLGNSQVIDADINTTKNEDKVELYSDDHKIVFKQVTGSYLVFYYEGNTITGYEAYLNYEDASTAAVALSVLKQDHSSYNNVKNIYQKGKYVVIEYNEDEYGAYTLEEIKLTYSALEQIQK